MKYLKYYLLLAGFVTVMIELFAKGFKHIDLYTLGMTVAAFAVVFIGVSCGGSCRVPGSDRYRSRHFDRDPRSE